MSNILITGATGNVGYEVIRFLFQIGTSDRIIAGVRNVEKARKTFRDFPKLEFVHFDFEDLGTFDNALVGINRVFLLRPPHISDVGKYFKPLVASIKNNHVNQVVFLSVQGAEKSKVIPHNKIERLITESGLNYIFLRPSYFMQNLTTTIIRDIQTKRAVILPSGQAKFNWVDVENIGEVGALVLNKFESYQNRAYEVTGLENESFPRVVSLLNQVVHNPIRYRNVNPLRFYFMKKREGMKTGMIIVMILLHYLPRFQKEPRLSGFYRELTAKQPTSLKTFIEREKDHFV